MGEGEEREKRRKGEEKGEEGIRTPKDTHTKKENFQRWNDIARNSETR